jgi:hypothetical protein
MSSCAFLVRPKTNFIIKNDSNHKMSIIFFEKTNILETIQIESKGKFEKSIVTDAGSNITTPFSTSTDSIVIKFDNKKSINYGCNGLKLYGNFGTCYFDKNLIDFVASGESSKKKFSDIVTKTITFNESDYEKAKEL